MYRAVLYFISCLLLYSVTLTEAIPYSDSSFCLSLDLFPALLHPCGDRGQNLIHCSGLTGTPQAVGWCNDMGFLPTSFSPVPNIWFVFFTVNVHWGGVSVEVCFVTPESHSKKTVMTDLCAQHWIGKNRYIFFFYAWFYIYLSQISFIYSVISSCYLLSYLIWSGLSLTMKRPLSLPP